MTDPIRTPAQPPSPPIPDQPPAPPAPALPPPAPLQRATTRVAARSGWRVGLALVACLALVVVAGVAMGASPAPSGASPSASPRANAKTLPAPAGRAWQRGSSLGPVFGLGPIGRPFRGAIRGATTITAVDGSSLALKTADGWTRTITVGSSTAITKGGQAITLSSLKVGDQIRFQERREGDGSYTITAIEVVLPTTAGRVTSKTSTTITIGRPDGSSQTITVDSATTYRVRGVGKASLVDVAVGMALVAQGTPGSGGSFTASSVAAGAPGRPMGHLGPLTPPRPGSPSGPPASPLSNE